MRTHHPRDGFNPLGWHPDGESPTAKAAKKFRNPCAQLIIIADISSFNN
jgi:hypothetical protein